jgi:hypothetical protein
MENKMKILHITKNIWRRFKSPISRSTKKLKMEPRLMMKHSIKIEFSTYYYTY